MADWKPKPKAGIRFEGMALTSEEGFVLSRLDGSSSLKDVVNVTGLPEGRVKQIVDKLVQQGAVDGPASAPAAPSIPGRGPALRPPTNVAQANAARKQAELEAARAALLDDPSGDHDALFDDDDAAGATSEVARPVSSPHDPTLDATMDDQPIVTEDGDVPAPIVARPVEAPDEVAVNDVPADEPPSGGDDGGDSGGDGGDDGSGDKSEDGEDKPGEDESESAQANYRQIYMTELSKLEVVEREAMAASAKDPQLLALCFDPIHSVIKQIFSNSNASFKHARMVARHHRTPQGLDIVLARAEFFRDPQTQRAMLTNPMLQDVQLKKLLQNKRLLDIFKTTNNRDLPERNRQKARHILRSKWGQVEGEERAGLIFTTEGRCLIALQGLPFDSQTTSLLCQKTYTSMLLIQNLVRFSATPPLVLSHLSKQAIVRRQPHLKTMIKQHPNCPSDVKRGLG